MINKKTCQGQIDGLMFCTEALSLSRLYRLKCRLKLGFSNAMLHLRKEGLYATLKLVLSKVLRFMRLPLMQKQAISDNLPQSCDKEVLNLKPGELVEIKSEKEILATLDEKRKYKGLLWMEGMNKHCGKRFKVYKRLEIILLESTGEYRKMKNTVLLENILCDGKAFNGCDRSCFHYWREVWLKRVKE